MATLAQIQSAVNARLADAFPKFRTRQETYRAAKGRYFQGLVWSSVPDDGALVSPNLATAPSDCFDPEVRDEDGEIVTPAVPHSWNFIGFNADLPATVEAQIRCDVYEAPGGVHGYRLTCRVSKAGVTYARTAQVEMGAVVTTGAWGAE